MGHPRPRIPTTGHPRSRHLSVGGSFVTVRMELAHPLICLVMARIFFGNSIPIVFCVLNVDEAQVEEAEAELGQDRVLAPARI